MAESEFGKGVVVCLVKFTEHLGTTFSSFDESLVREYSEWCLMSVDDRAKAPVDLAERMDMVDKIYKRDDSEEAALSHLIEMWMNGASDHFYDLDEEKAPPALQKLAELTLRIGHGFGIRENLWTMHHVYEIRELWKKSCRELDDLLGVEDGDWGQW